MTPRCITVGGWHRPGSGTAIDIPGSYRSWLWIVPASLPSHTESGEVQENAGTFERRRSRTFPQRVPLTTETQPTVVRLRPRIASIRTSTSPSRPPRRRKAGRPLARISAGRYAYLRRVQRELALPASSLALPLSGAIHDPATRVHHLPVRFWCWQLQCFS